MALTGQALIAVDVDAAVDARAVHLGQHMEDLRRALQCRRGIRFARRQKTVGPFAIQVRAAGVGAEVAAEAAVRVDARHDVEGGRLSQLAGDGLRRVRQAAMRAAGSERGGGM